MDDYTKHLLDRLEKAMEDSRALGRLAIGTVVTLGLAILAAHGKGDELVPGLLSGVGIAFTLILLVAYGLWSRALWLNDEEIKSIAKALEQGDRALEPGDRALEPGDRALEPGDHALEQGDRALEQGDRALGQAAIDPNLERLLETKIQYRRRSELYLVRRAVVGVSLFVIWFHLADIDDCIMHGKCGWVVAEQVPLTIKSGETELRLNGSGERRIMEDGRVYYIGSLYLTTPSGSSEQILQSQEPKVFRMRFTTDVTKDQAARAFRDAVERGCPAPCSTAPKADVDKFVESLQAFKVNDVVTLEIAPQRAVIMLNGRPLGTNLSPGVAAAVLRGFVDSSIKDKQLRRLRCDLLGFPDGKDCS